MHDSTNYGDDFIDRTGGQMGSHLSMSGSNIALTGRLYVEIVPLEAKFAPAIHPIRHANFDTGYIYKVLGIHIPSETSEYYLLLTNTRREIWLISNRHLRTWGLIDSDELFMLREDAPPAQQAEPLATANGNGNGRSNGHSGPPRPQD
jgi:hypothetical protein